MRDGSLLKHADGGDIGQERGDPDVLGVEPAVKPGGSPPLPVPTCHQAPPKNNLAAEAFGQALKHRGRALLLTGEGANDDQRAGQCWHGPLQDRKLLLC
jgi:hypothetical protein